MYQSVSLSILEGVSLYVVHLLYIYSFIEVLHGIATCLLHGSRRCPYE